MAYRAPSESEEQFALWNFARSRPPKGNRRVVVAHQDRAVGQSISMLLKIKSLETVFAENAGQAGQLIKTWGPSIVLLDTRLDNAPDYSFAKHCRSEKSSTDLLLIAMSNFAPRESIENLKLAGFDGHFRRPCETWRIIDVLITFLQYSDMTA